MPDIDNLSIKIESSASDANTALDALAKNLRKLGRALEKLSGASANMTTIAQGISNIGAAVNGIDSKNLENLATVVKTVGKNVDDVAKKAEKATTSLQKMGDAGVSSLSKAGQQLPESVKNLPAIFSEATDKISDMREGIVDLSDEDYKIADVGEDVKDVGEKAKKSAGSLGLLAARAGALTAFGNLIGQVSNALGKVGSFGQNLLEKAYNPEGVLKGLVTLPVKVLPPLQKMESVVKEKLSNVSNLFKKMGKSAIGTIERIGQSAGKILQRFQFTLLRKAINAVITDLDAAAKSLAQFAGKTGQAFNQAMSSMASNAKWLGSSIVAAFSPLASVVAPIIDMIVQKLVAAIRVIGMFFAALTGKGTVAVASKSMVNFGAATDKAAKSAKKLQTYLLGIDELNVFQPQEDNDSGSGAGGAADPFKWEEVKVPDNIKKFADKVKDILSKLFDPLKKAWDKAGAYVIAGFKYMTNQLARLAKSIGRDFLKMWNEQETIDMLANILYIIGDIEFTVGHLARRFREAWDENERGLHILENIRDIFAIFIEHVRNITAYMSQWAYNLQFKSLLQSFEELTKSLYKVSDFLGGVFEDVMKSVVLKYIKYLIEVGLPDLFEAIKRIVDAFDFDDLRAKLQPLWDAFERFLENVDEGKTRAIENVGVAIANWTKSEAFEQFLGAIEHILSLFTAERVEKFFTALGNAVLLIAEDLAKFVSSEGFQNFLDKLAEWFDSVDGDTLAKWLKRIAEAVLVFKFTAFVGEGLSGFIKFVSMLRIVNGLNNVAKNLKGASSGIDSVSTSLVGLGASLSIIDKLKGIFSKSKESDAREWLSENMPNKDDFQSVEDFKKAYHEMAEEYEQLFDVSSFGTNTIFKNNALFSDEQLEAMYNNSEMTGENIRKGINAGLLKGEQIDPQPIWQSIVAPIKSIFGIESPAENMKPIGEFIFLGIIEGFQNSFESFTSAITEFWDNYVAPWFTAEQWQNLGQGILDGISTKWTEFTDWWQGTAIYTWWEDHVKPWFSFEKWTELANGIKTGIKTKWDETVKQWGESIKSWWDNHVAPWFAREKWTTLLKDIPTVFKTAFKSAANGVIGMLNKIIEGLEKMINLAISGLNTMIGSLNSVLSSIGISIPTITVTASLPRIPTFIDGGFVPYGNPSSYSLFAAGENGIPEMVGQVGGRPAVASGEEITGIREAVNASGDRQEALLGQIINLAQALLDKDPVIFGDRQIAEANRRGVGQLGMAIIS